MTLPLPHVTLVCYEVAAHRLARIAIDTTLSHITPAAVLVFSDQDLGVGQHIPVSADTPKVESSRTLYRAPEFVTTSHMLDIEWDSGINDAAQWTDEFLEYDYIGAPWPWHPPAQQVGNGGFSLRSIRLLRFINEHYKEFPVEAPEDDVLCRHYRPALERHGFKWAPIHVAQRFSFERERPHPTFGYHGIFNWPFVLGREAIAVRVAAADDRLRARSEWDEFVQNANRMT